MKAFLITSASLLGLVLILVAAAFFYVQRALVPEPRWVSTPASATSSLVTEVVSETTGSPMSPETDPRTSEREPMPSATVPILAEPLPLSALPLTDAQRSLLSSAGIDVATFMITPDMVVCAQSALGNERFAEIVAGDAPGVIEIYSLLRCL